MSEKHFGNVLREARQAAGLTMEEVGLRAGCSKQYIWVLEHRETSMRASAAALNRIAKTLNMSLETLAGESPRAVADSLPPPETDADAQFFKDYLALSREDRRRLRQACELVFGSASPERPAQEAPDVRRRKSEKPRFSRLF